MKHAVAFLTYVCLAATACADLFIIQEMKSPMMNGEIFIKIKGDKMRLDMAFGPAGAMSTLIDTVSGDTTTLIHAQRMALKMPGAQLRQTMEALQKQAGGAKPAPPKPTGKTEKVGEYNTEIYTWAANGTTQTLWIAKDFPNYSKLKPHLKRLHDSPMAGPGKGMSPDLDALPGMVVKMEGSIAGQKVSMTVVSVKETNFDAGIFETPADYQTIAQPGLPPP
ncbi:MAG: DUF4412 domain-containing protein [Verrucomicrobiae bacterium]|nr:DUF4412 domain-containing protein [Verrucomicrobiae bacterium]